MTAGHNNEGRDRELGDERTIVDQGPGEPDHLQRLWTPHRMSYIAEAPKRRDGSGSARSEQPFTDIPAMTDEDGLVVARGELVYAVLNLYPYNPGHLLICPYRHVADYVDLTSAEREELGEMKAQAMTVIRRVSKPAGFNLGMNQGAAAGAGIEAHLHEHVVPRWTGDANFLPIIATTRALPVVLGDTWRLLHEAWPPMDERSSAC